MITFAVEQFDDCYLELCPLLEQHYREISTHAQRGYELEPQVAVYRARQADGSLVMVIGREAGAIVAYMVMFVAPALHYANCMTALPDIFYVSPDARGARVGLEMFRWAEKILKRRGVKRWAVGCKAQHDAGALFTRLGFEPVERTFEKWL